MKKRKKERDGAGNGLGRKRIVGNELLIQSLILGSLACGLISVESGLDINRLGLSI